MLEMKVIDFYHYYLFGTPGNKLKSYASGTGKKIKNLKFGDIIVVAEDIKKTLFGPVGCRTRLEVLRRLKNSAFIFAAYDTQLRISSWFEK
jgi:hypothetical protein